MKKQQHFLRTVVGTTVTGLLVGTPVLWPQLARATGQETGAPRHVVRAQSSETAAATPAPAAKNPGGLVGALLRRNAGNAPAAAAAPQPAATPAAATPAAVAPSISPPAGSSTAPAASLTKSNPPAAAPPKPVEVPQPVEAPAATAAATTSAPDDGPKVQQVSGTTTSSPEASEEPGFFSRIFGGSDEEPNMQDPSRRDMRRTLRDQKKSSKFGVPPAGGDRATARSNTAGQPLSPSKAQLGQQSAAAATPSHASSKPTGAAPSTIQPQASDLDLYDIPFAEDAPLPAAEAPATNAVAAAPGLISPEAPAGAATNGVAAPEFPSLNAPPISPAPPVEAALGPAAAPANEPAIAAPAVTPQEEVWNPFADTPAEVPADAAPLAVNESSEFFTPAAALPQEPGAFPAAPETPAEIPAAEPLPLAEAAPPETFTPPESAQPAADPLENPFTGLKLGASPYTGTSKTTGAASGLNKPAPPPAPAALPKIKPLTPVQPAAPFVPPEPESFESTAVEPLGTTGDGLVWGGDPLLAPGGLEHRSESIDEDSTLIAPTLIPQTTPDPINAPSTAKQLQPDDAAHESDTQAKLARLAQRQHQLGLKGFCLVSLTDDRDLVDARPEYSTVYEGQKYYFCSEEALAEFEAAPGVYAPAAGGHDVVHLAFTGESQPGSLDHAVWYKGKLYMFGSVETMETFVAAPSSHAGRE